MNTILTNFNGFQKSYFNGFQKSLRPCLLDERNLSIGGALILSSGKMHEMLYRDRISICLRLNVETIGEICNYIDLINPCLCRAV